MSEATSKNSIDASQQKGVSNYTGNPSGGISALHRRLTRGLRFIGILLLIFLVVILVGPFLVPIPPLAGTHPIEQLADSDGHFVTLEGIKVYYKSAGQGQPSLVLLHGFAASLYSWHTVMPALAANHAVVAFDRPAFGLTERPLKWQGLNPYSAQANIRLTLAMMDQAGMKKAVLIGNSAGGTLAVQVALEHPERVVGLVLVDPAIYTAGQQDSRLLSLLYQTPQAHRLGPLFIRNIQSWGKDFARQAWHDPTKITDEMWAEYLKPLQADNWDRALWEFYTAAGQSPDITSRLKELKMPVLVITGDDDRIVPTSQSVRLAGELSNSQLVVIPQCGHVPQEEKPQEFLAAVQAFLAKLTLQ